MMLTCILRIERNFIKNITSARVWTPLNVIIEILIYYTYLKIWNWIIVSMIPLIILIIFLYSIFYIYFIYIYISKKINETRTRNK